MLEMRLWVESDNPDYQKAVEERLAELRAKAGAEKKRIKAERVELRALLAKAATKAAKEFGATLRERKKCRAKKRENAEAEREWSKPGVKEAKEYRAKLRARNKLRLKKKNNVRAFAVRLAVRENREQFSRDLFDGLLSIIPREKSEVVLCASPPKEEGGLSDSEIWNGYGWEKD
jgi:arginine utilization protein RocB